MQDFTDRRLVQMLQNDVDVTYRNVPEDIVGIFK